MLSSLFQFQQALGVAEVQTPAIVLPQLEGVDRLEGLADEQRAALGVEGAVGAKQDMFCSIKINPTPNGGGRTVARGAAVKHLEETHRPLLHALEQPPVVLVGSARAELV